MSDPLDDRAGPARIHALAAAGLLDAAAVERAMTLADRRATGDSWYRFARVQLILLGVVLAVVGAIFFIAANWDALPPGLRIGLAAATMAAATLAGGWIGLDRLSGRAAALAGGLLFGPLMALVGQIYQTGADAYALFLAWSLVLVGYALATRFSGAWATALALGVTTAYLWTDQALASNPFERPGLWVSLGVAAATAAIALVRRPGPRDPVHAIAVTVAWLVTFGHGAAAIATDVDGRGVALLWALALPVALLVIGRQRGDDGLTRLGAAMLLGLLAVLEGKIVFDEMDMREAGLLVMGFLLIVQGYLGGRWLLRRHHPGSGGAA